MNMDMGNDGLDVGLGAAGEKGEQMIYLGNTKVLKDEDAIDGGNRSGNWGRVDIKE